MAGGYAAASAFGKDYQGHLTVFVIFVCLVSATGGLIFGYDIGISGGVTSMDTFLEKFFPDVYARVKKAHTNQYCKFDDQLLTTFTSSLYIAGLIASFFASATTRVLGRKPSILMGGVFFLTGAALNGSAVNVIMLILGRIFLGVGVGFGNQSVPLYLSEMAPPRVRGALGQCFQLFVTIGVLLANLINYGTQRIQGWGWRLSLGLAAVPASIMITGSLMVPDTPNSLIERGYREQAKDMLVKMRGTQEVDAEFQDLVEASEASRKVRHPFRNILQRKYRPQLVMAIAIPMFQQLTGINVIAFYAPVLFKILGFGENANLISAIMPAISLAATVTAMVIADRMGRRVLFMAGGIMMFFPQMAIAAILGVGFDNTGEGNLSGGDAAVVVVCICIYVLGFASSWGPLGWLVPSEIYPLEIRSAGQSITVSVNLLLSFVVAQTFLAMLCEMKYGIFVFFGGCVFAMTAFVYWLLPETRNVPIEEMSVIWQTHWFWSSYVSSSSSSSSSPTQNTEVSHDQPFVLRRQAPS